MICPICGAENRTTARFCNRCGTQLPEKAAARVPEPRPISSPPSVAGQEAVAPADTTQAVGKVGLFGGHGLIAFGALIALFAFMLPWASCSGIRLSGLDIVTQSPQYGGDASWSFLTLVPLGALVLLVLGIVGIAVNFLGKALPANLARLMPFLPLLAILPGLCGCCPSCLFFLNMQSARSDPDSLGLGVLVQIEYGFWFTLFGLGVSFIGIVVALVGGLLAQQRASSGAGPPS
jgi:hypothetical protein